MKPVVDNENGRRADLAKIHIAIKDLGWSHDEYHDILRSVCHVESSAELDFTGRKRFLAHLERCGWKRRANPKDRRQATDSQSKMMRGLWLELHELGYVEDPAESALAAWVARETKVDALQWLTTAQARQTIEKLKQWRDRDARKLQSLVWMLFNRGAIPTAQLDELALAWFGTSRLTRSVAARMLTRLKMEGSR